ncbi:Fic family protein [Flavobacterium sp. DG1-102-2]|uniref:Fic family protein n=1 Tax=Flavobacterium sp. DG1-102-2 TaxID=3081663 RepID=UPI002949DADD|nr:Fic family protein [Flavobacterium sp. DG1-102-2]MDV6169647.1 Fic family protein [Flavobacterium sp. DG1-102-2]
MYIYQKKEWPNFTWNSEQLLPLLGKVRSLQGILIGKMSGLGFDLINEASLEIITQDVLKSSEIEGELLNPVQVRSSVAVRLGVELPGIIPADRNTEGVVDMMLDATQNYTAKLSDERLFGWHHAMFPSGRSGLYKIVSGNWRGDANGPMQVVSGSFAKQKVHFEAPPATALPQEMQQFTEWFNGSQDLDAVIKAGMAHLWFVTLHPFDDGNGRIARAIADMQLARADGIQQRFYSMSSQIQKDRKTYYEILETTQKGNLDITEWLEWFLLRLYDAIQASEITLNRIVSKHKFWDLNRTKIDNKRQQLMLERLLDGFEGNLTTSKWAKITKSSTDTALRDINDLIAKDILRKTESGGRSTNYELVTC